MRMEFITADTATAESIDDAIDDAFEAVGVRMSGEWVRSQISEQILENLKSYAMESGVERSLILRGRSRALTSLRSKFILAQYGLGYSGGEIERATGMSRNVVYGTLARAKK